MNATFAWTCVGRHSGPPQPSTERPRLADSDWRDLSKWANRPGDDTWGEQLSPCQLSGEPYSPTDRATRPFCGRQFSCRTRYAPNSIRALLAPAPSTPVAHSRALAPALTHQLINKRLEPLPRPPAYGPPPALMGPSRRRTRDTLPVHDGEWRCRSTNGRIGLRAARYVAAVWCATDRCGWRACWVVVACGSAEPGGRPLWRRVLRARCELT